MVNEIMNFICFIYIITCRNYGNTPIPVKYCPPENDRRDMSLTHCPETDYNTKLPFLKIRLIGIGYYRRVKKCGRFNRIFMCKIRTYKQFTPVIQFINITPGHFYISPYPLAMAHQFFGNTPVSFGKILKQRGNNIKHFLLIQCQYFF